MNTKDAVKRTAVERARLRTMVGRGRAPARPLTRARSLLQAHPGEGGPGWTDAAIAGAMDAHPATVARVRRESVPAGLDAALARRSPDRPDPRRRAGARAAHRVARACSAPPAGRERGTWRLLATELGRLAVVEPVSSATVRRT